jgi:hypothetical protein
MVRNRSQHLRQNITTSYVSNTPFETYPECKHRVATLSSTNEIDNDIGRINSVNKDH